MNGPVDLAHLRQWLGRTRQDEDVAAAWPVRALAATLGEDAGPLAAGDPLPPGRHWLYFLQAAPAGELAPDGHPRRGGFLPPVPLPRRMWAGGRLAFRRLLRIGRSIRRDSTIVAIEVKPGRSGQLVLVTVRHAVSDQDGICLTEDHDIVYLERPRHGDAAPPRHAAPADASWRQRIEADPVLLFRFSALTFNAHRIHYDRRYVADEEGYPGLVVHGPLQAMLLLDLVRRHAGGRRLSGFAFRSHAPLFDGATLRVEGTPADGGARLWVADADGGLAMSATADFADPEA